MAEKGTRCQGPSEQSCRGSKARDTPRKTRDHEAGNDNNMQSKFWSLLGGKSNITRAILRGQKGTQRVAENLKDSTDNMHAGQWICFLKKSVSLL
jgi:hypothetical protein